MVKAKLICPKKFRPCNYAEVFIWENFHDIDKWVGRPSHMNMSKMFTKEMGVRRDLSHRASPVNQAPLKGPLEQ